MGKSINLYSIVVPVYNRPDDLKALLDSIAAQRFERDYEVIVIEDGSEFTAKNVCDDSVITSKIKYFSKPNSGPGLSRNYGMKRAQGDYFILLDSDCILPENYLSEVDKELNYNYTDMFGGPDAALESFSDLQKAVNLVMTSKLSTAGIRGAVPNYFEPRSFNMGLSREVFNATKGFGAIHPGEDPDLVMRAWKSGFSSRLFTNAFVYHKRRINFTSFFKQVYRFGSVRPILEVMHPQFKRSVYKGPSLFLIYCITVVLGGIGFFLNLWGLLYLVILCLPFILYLGTFKLHLIYNTLSIKLTTLSVYAFFVQMFGYGLGYLRSKIRLALYQKESFETLFPNLFFNFLDEDQ